MSFPSVGSAAPAFSTVDQSGNKHSLSQYAGQWVLLYFYPKDSTPGCTIEACTLRDNYDSFKKIKAVVLGVSVDSQASHQKFADKHELPFPLLVDEDKKIVNAYGVWGEKKFMGRKYMGTNRMSFLIDPAGKIAKVYEKVTPGKHAEEVLNDLNNLRIQR